MDVFFSLLYTTRYNIRLTPFCRDGAHPEGGVPPFFPIGGVS